MSNLENFSQESSELKEINWVKQQIKAELQSLQSTATQEAFYTKNPDTGKVDYNLATVKSYLESIKDRDWKGLRAKNTSAWIMAVQIALEAQGYDGGKIDGVF